MLTPAGVGRRKEFHRTRWGLAPGQEEVLTCPASPIPSQHSRIHSAATLRRTYLGVGTTELSETS